MNDVESRTEPGPTPVEPLKRPWYRRPRPLVALTLVVILVAGAAFVAYRFGTRGAKQVSTKSVIEKYRKQASGGATAAGILRPAAGVYEYRANGTEKLSVLSTTQQWGPTMPATVTSDADGCWRVKIEFSTNHTHTLQYCPRANTLTEVGGIVYQAFDFGVKIDSTSTFVCKPAVVALDLNDAPGTQRSASCSGNSDMGTNTVSAGTNTFVGVETLDIGGQKIPALHYRQQRTITVDQKGTEDTNYWFSPADGMILKGSRNMRVASPSPIGDVIYTEVGEFALVSTLPQQ